MSETQQTGAGEAITTPGDAPAEVQLAVDDAAAGVLYSTTARVSGSAEEVYLDFAGGIRAAGPNRAVLRIDQRVIVSPWGAKRLALALAQIVANYERQYGVLEMDPRKRALGGAAPAPAAAKAN